MQNNSPVVINKAMFNFFICTIFFLLSSVLVLMGMIWKLSKNFDEHKQLNIGNRKTIQDQGAQIQDLEELTRIEGQTIEAIVNNLEKISRNCCEQPTNATAKPGAESKSTPQGKKRSGPDCMVAGINVCIPISATDLHTFLPCRCAQILN
ncbi:hypothetical protein IT412_03875 [Candidatus Peregrinibacteria bacterium]|nr:hypothetical protein [Candidatus Peregrinibacteria bacterium]